MSEILPPGPHRTILRGWAILAVTALALAGFALIVPAASKVPALENAVDWPDSFFQKGLVAHVALSFIVWFLAVLAILAQTAVRPPDRERAAGLRCRPASRTPPGSRGTAAAPARPPRPGGTASRAGGTPTSTRPTVP